MDTTLVVAAGSRPTGYLFTPQELRDNMLMLTVVILQRSLDSVEVHSLPEPLAEPESEKEGASDDDRNPYLESLKKHCPSQLPKWGKLCDTTDDYAVGDRVFRVDEEGNQVDAVIGAFLTSGYVAVLPKRASRIQYWHKNVISGILA